MKRVNIILCCVLSFALISNKSFAYSNISSSLEELKDNNPDYLEIIDLEEQIIEMLRDIAQNVKGESLPEDIKINFEFAKKIYVDSDIFSIETSEKEEIEKKLINSTYMWLLILNIGDDTYQIHIAKGLPLDESIIEMLTDEEIQQIKDDEGNWIVSGIELIQGETIDYEKIITDILEYISYDTNNIEIAICGGLEYINQPVALVMNNDEVDLLIPLYDLEVEGTEKQIQSIKPDTAEKDDEVYLYEGIMDAVNDMERLDEDFSGRDAYIVLSSESSRIEYPIVPIVITFMTLSSLVIYFKMKRQSRKK